MELRHEANREGRLSSFLKQELGMSTGLVNRLKWQERIFVDGVARHNDYLVRPGQVITAFLDEPQPQYPAENGPLTVIYEDDHILAVEKNAGMLIHPSRAANTGTLANRVLAYYQRTGQQSAFHPITRLDRDTFGIVLLAKNAHIHALFGRSDLKKTYEAWVFGGPQEETGEIDAPIARRPLPSLLLYVNQEGKPSLTRYRVLERREGCTRLQLQPVTGRTHQLRVHCAYMGYPVLGDPQYGTAQSKEFSEKYNLSHQLLWASCLEFTHPVTGDLMILSSAQRPVLF